MYPVCVFYETLIDLIPNKNPNFQAPNYDLAWTRRRPNKSQISSFHLPQHLKFWILVIAICPSTLLRVVSPSTLLRTVSLSNHLIFVILWFGIFLMQKQHNVLKIYQDFVYICGTWQLSGALYWQCCRISLYSPHIAGINWRFADKVCPNDSSSQLFRSFPQF